MAMKVALVALALVVAWLVLLRPLRGESSAPKQPPAPPPTKLERCPGCGVYRLPGSSCQCDDPGMAG